MSWQPRGMAMALALIVSTRVNAGPLLDVRARAEITLWGAIDEGPTQVITGWVKEPDGTPLPGIRIVAKRAGHQGEAITFGGGEFRAQLPTAVGPVTLLVEDDTADAAPLSAEPRLVLPPPRLALTITASAGGALVQLTSEQPLPRPCEVQLDGEVAGSITVAEPQRIATSAPGDHSVRVVCNDANAQLLESVTGRFVVIAEPQVALRAVEADIFLGSPIALQVTVAPPPPAGRITLTANGTLVTTAALTDGKVRLEVPSTRLGLGAHTLVATSDAVPTFAEAQSAPLVVRITNEPPFPVRRAAAALIVILFGAAGFAAWRWQARPRPSPKPPSTPRVGATPSRASFVDRILPARHYVVRLHVLDVDRGTSLGGHVASTSGPQPIDAAVDATAPLTLTLAAGTHRFTITAPGYMPAEFIAVVPHRGELKDVTVGLRSVRDYIFELYRPAALRHLPRAELWSVWSPREIFAQARGTARPQLRALTDLVEHVYFAPALPPDGWTATLAQAEQLVHAALLERADTGPVIGSSRQPV